MAASRVSGFVVSANFSFHYQNATFGRVDGPIWLVLPSIEGIMAALREQKAVAEHRTSTAPHDLRLPSRGFHPCATALTFGAAQGSAHQSQSQHDQPCEIGVGVNALKAARPRRQVLLDASDGERCRRPKPT